MTQVIDPFIQKAETFLNSFVPPSIVFDEDYKLYKPLDAVLVVGSDPILVYGTAKLMKQAQNQFGQNELSLCIVEVNDIFNGYLGKVWQKFQKTEKPMGITIESVFRSQYSSLKDAVDAGFTILYGIIRRKKIEREANIAIITSYRDAPRIELFSDKIRSEIEFDVLWYMPDLVNFGRSLHYGMTIADNIPWFTAAAKFAKLLIDGVESGKLKRPDVGMQFAKLLVERYPLANDKFSWTPRSVFQFLWVLCDCFILRRKVRANLRERCLAWDCEASNNP